jgi:hypothetical protein
MHAMVRHIKFLLALVALVILAGLAPQALAQESSNYDDPFYSQKGTNKIIEDRHLSPFQQVNESVDPFTRKR